MKQEDLGGQAAVTSVSKRFSSSIFIEKKKNTSKRQLNRNLF